MEQNKVRTYLLYSVGEILLVVIGILIALQIDELSQSRDSEIAVGTVMLNAGKFLESGLHTLNPDSLNTMLSYTIANRSVNTYDATFEDLKSTGNIRIISNEDLKRQILEFYQSIDRADRVLQKNELIKANIRESMIKNSFTNLQVDYEKGLTAFLESSGLPALNPITDHNGQFNFNITVLKNIDSEEGFLKLNNIITSRYFSSLVTVATIQPVKNSAVDLKKSIESELNKEY